MLQIAANWLEQEAKEIAEAKEAYMAEKCPAPDLSGDQAALMVQETRDTFTVVLHLSPYCNFSFFKSSQEFCKKLYLALDKIDEDRYDAEAKVEKSAKEVHVLPSLYRKATIYKLTTPSTPENPNSFVQRGLIKNLIIT